MRGCYCDILRGVLVIYKGVKSGMSSPRDDGEFADESWVPEESLSFLTQETLLHPDETPVERAKRLMTENVDTAAATMIWIARNSDSERNRAEASKYIMERVLGRAGDAPATGTLDDLFARLDKMNELAAAHSQAGPHSSGTELDDE
jgi:hypothetical protein